MAQECIICKTKFKTLHAQKTCSETCRITHHKNIRKLSDDNIAVVRFCRFCGESFKAKRYKTKSFCNRSCASKFHVKDGTYDKWKACKPMLGRRVTVDQIERQKNTMIRKYGVSCGYNLSKARRISKQQKIIYAIVKEIDQTSLIEKLVPKSKYFADIILLDKKKIIEYNGDYWHCNPKKYDADYFNKKIKKYAKDIWENDLQRRKSLENLGYSILCIWESDFINNRELMEWQIKEFVTG
jgi:G:T-mismatch repair DNA endonuclease (very short patch repair protein)